MTTMPEALLLLATDDRKGTVFPSAWLALDHALRGAALAELRLCGGVQTRGGQIRRTERAIPSTGSHTVDQVAERLRSLPSPALVGEWLAALRTSMPTIRERVAEELHDRGVLGSEGVERALLPESVSRPLRDPAIERAILDSLEQGLEAGEAIDARNGTLLALCDASNLVPRVIPKGRREAAHAIAAFVAGKDSIVTAVREAIQDVEGGS